MTFRDWVRESIERYQTVPAPQATRANYLKFKEGLYNRLGVPVGGSVSGGTNIFDIADWDVMIVLDALRPDVFRGVSREYAWLPTHDVTEYTSMGGYSLHWLEETFSTARFDTMAKTGFVAWNPYTGITDVDYKEICQAFNPVHQYGWDSDYGAVPPGEITDAGLSMWPDVDRMILWYMQPHAPYRSLLDKVERLNDEQIGNEDNNRLTVWNLIRSGGISRNEALMAYADNLRWVLDDVERLIAEYPDARYKITGDHGELFGEGGRYGHPKNQYHDYQLRVPLVSPEPKKVGDPLDYKELAEDGSITQDPTDPTTKDQLKALGYV